MEIQTMFMLLNRNVDFDQDFLTRTGLDGFLRLPMSNESVEVPEELMVALVDVIETFKGVGKSNPKPIKYLISLLAKYKSLLSKHVDEKTIQESAFTQITSILNGDK